MTKKILTTLVVVCAIYSAPVLMDHARDIYLTEVVSKKAHPVKIPETKTVGSSWQVKFQGMRLTVTNNHVCNVVQSVQRRKDRQEAQYKYYVDLVSMPVEKAKKRLAQRLDQIRKKQYQVVGQSLKIGNLNRKILYMSDNHDLCFLEPVGNASFSLASGVHRGERITIIGHPRGMSQSISDGRIVGEGSNSLNLLPKAGVVKYLLSTAIAYPGVSGSPAVNRYGNVVGVLFAGFPIAHANINFIVPLQVIHSELLAYKAAK